MTKNQSLKFGFIFCLVVCLPLLSLGGTADWQRTFSYSKFSHVSFPHSASTTTSACMQENGMLWFGTRQGLFNFNGYGLHRITNGNNPAANSIQTVIEVGRNLCVGGTCQVIAVCGQRPADWQSRQWPVPPQYEQWAPASPALPRKGNDASL